MTDAGLATLCSMPALQWVDLNYTKVTDASVAKARSMRPALFVSRRHAPQSAREFRFEVTGRHRRERGLWRDCGATQAFEIATKGCHDQISRGPAGRPRLSGSGHVSPKFTRPRVETPAWHGLPGGSRLSR